MAKSQETWNKKEKENKKKKKREDKSKKKEERKANTQAADENDGNRTGIVSFFDSSKGYGFIKDLETQESIFTHIGKHLEEIKEGNKVTFRTEKGPKGMNAVEVRKAK